MSVNLDYLKCNLGKIQKIKYGDKIINLDTMPSYDISVKDNILNVDNIKIPLNVVDEMDLLKVKIYIPEFIGVYHCLEPIISEVITYKEALENFSKYEDDEFCIISRTSHTFEIGSNFNIDKAEKMFSEALDDIKNKYESIRLYFDIWGVIRKTTEEIAFLDIDKVEFIPNEFYIKRTESIKKIDRFLSERGLRRDYYQKTNICRINDKSCIVNILGETANVESYSSIPRPYRHYIGTSSGFKRNFLDKVFNFI